MLVLHRHHILQSTLFYLLGFIFLSCYFGGGGLGCVFPVWILEIKWSLSLFLFFFSNKMVDTFANFQLPLSVVLPPNCQQICQFTWYCSLKPLSVHTALFCVHPTGRIVCFILKAFSVCVSKAALENDSLFQCLLKKKTLLRLDLWALYWFLFLSTTNW